MGTLGTTVNFGAAAAALVAGGPYWAVIVFLSIALVRITLDAHVLRRENELLQERVVALQGNDDVPESGVRPSRELVAKRVS